MGASVSAVGARFRQLSVALCANSERFRRHVREEVLLAGAGPAHNGAAFPTVMLGNELQSSC